MVESNSKTLYQALWNSADILRSKMDASDYKNYLLGLVFHKYLSDRMLHYAVDLLEEAGDLVTAQIKFTQAFEDVDLREDLISALKYEYSYVIEPSLTFTSFVTAIHNGEFQLESVAQGFRNIEQSV